MFFVINLHTIKKRKLKNHNLLTGLIFALVLFAGCAKIGNPTGGKKDVAPPVLISSKPLNYSTNFNSQKIEMEFDEFIALKNVNKELIISPPLPKKPDVRIKNKSIVIDLKNDLRANTTYTLNFGVAITDNNEGNPLTNFEFVFSTGDYLDSLSVNGTVLNAFNHLPSKESIIVGMYDQSEDSVPMKTIPVYVGKTDEEGNFQINNIKADTFKLFALKDLNSNLLFDLPSEEIAFIDTLITLTPEFLRTLPIIVNDSIKADTLDKVDLIANNKNLELKKINSQDISHLADSPQDSLVTDTLKRKNVLPSLFVDMFYFLPEGTKQYMTNKDRLSVESFQLSFSLPLNENPPINVLNYEEVEGWLLTEFNAQRDTFTYWITDTTLMKMDTLMLELTYPMTDSAGAIFSRLDTLKFISRKPIAKSGKGKTDAKTQPVKLIVNTLRNKGLLDLNKDVFLNFNFPIEAIDTSRLHVYAKVDTIDVLQKFEIIPDSISTRKMILKSKWKEQNKYRIEVFPGAFMDIYNHTNDTLITSFSVQEKSSYGTLTTSLTGVKTPVIVQLMNEKEQVLRTGFAVTDGALIFGFLPPAKYKIKFVFDVNNNKKWDTGDYVKKVQPEKIMYYVGEINIRSNWELEVKQDLGKQ